MNIPKDPSQDERLIPCPLLIEQHVLNRRGILDNEMLLLNRSFELKKNFFIWDILGCLQK